MSTFKSVVHGPKSLSSFALCICAFINKNTYTLSVVDLPVMVGQVHAVLCGTMGSHAHPYSDIHDQSVHTTGTPYLAVYLFNFLFFMLSQIEKT